MRGRVMLGAAIVSLAACTTPRPTIGGPPITTIVPHNTRSCLTGTWTTTGQVFNGTQEGGAGATWTYGTDGMLTIDDGGSAAVISGATYGGREVYDFTVTPAPGNAEGAGTETPISGGFTFTDDNGVTTKLPLGGPANFTWGCSKHALTVAIGSGDAVLATMLKR